jgi:hypothetical protein
MSCNCVRDNEARLAEHYTKQLGIAAKAEAKNVAIVFGGGVSERPYLPYAIKADKPGWRSAKGKEISMFFNFCPFCGVSTAEQKEGASSFAIE